MFVTSVLNAQIKKGSIFLGGDISGSTHKTKRDGVVTNSQDGVVISPVFGKAIKENLILGVNAGIGFYENNSAASSSQKNNFYEAGIFLRKYKPIGKSGFSIFLQGGLDVNYNSNEYILPPSDFSKTKRYTIGINAYPGISYTVNKRLQLETGFNNLLHLGYFTERREFGGTFPSTDKSSGINISTSLSLDNLAALQLGFRLLISKK